MESAFLLLFWPSVYTALLLMTLCLYQSVHVSVCVLVCLLVCGLVCLSICARMFSFFALNIEIKKKNRRPATCHCVHCIFGAVIR